MGDLGNGVQQASLMKCIRIATGIDDTNPDCLLLIPRLANGWTSVHASDYPVVINNKDNNYTETARIDMFYEQGEKNRKLILSSDLKITEISVRIEDCGEALSVKVNNKNAEHTERHTTDESGEWLWIENLIDVKSIEIEISHCKPEVSKLTGTTTVNSIYVNN